MNINPTPTPWQAEEVFDGRLVITDEIGFGIADCGLTMSLVAHANARFIVRACNSHDQLLAALKELLGLVESNAPAGHYTENPIITRARAAAEGAVLGRADHA